jgi:hypothetical protein
VSLTRHVVWCPRSRHKLAWLEADDQGQLVVVAAAVAPGRDRLAFGESRVPESALADCESTTIMVGCGCNRRWTLDLNAVLRGETQTVHRVTGDDFPGVSYIR